MHDRTSNAHASTLINVIGWTLGQFGIFAAIGALATRQMSGWQSILTVVALLAAYQVNRRGSLRRPWLDVAAWTSALAAAATVSATLDPGPLAWMAVAATAFALGQIVRLYASRRTGSLKPSAPAGIKHPADA